MLVEVLRLTKIVLGFPCLEEWVWRLYSEVKVQTVTRSVGPIYGKLKYQYCRYKRQSTTNFRGRHVSKIKHLLFYLFGDTMPGCRCSRDWLSTEGRWYVSACPSYYKNSSSTPQPPSITHTHTHTHTHTKFTHEYLLEYTVSAAIIFLEE